MIVFEYMDEEEKKLYRSIYNQKNLESFDPDTYTLVFHSGELKYSLHVSSLKHPNLSLEYLKSLNEEDFFDRIVDGAEEKHTISKEMFELMLDDWFADHDPEEDVDGPLKVEEVKQNEDEEEEWELEAYAEDDHHAYVFTDYYENIILNSLNTSF